MQSAACKIIEGSLRGRKTYGLIAICLYGSGGGGWEGRGKTKDEGGIRLSSFTAWQGGAVGVIYRLIAICLYVGGGQEGRDDECKVHSEEERLSRKVAAGRHGD